MALHRDLTPDSRPLNYFLKAAHGTQLEANLLFRWLDPP